MRQFLCELVIRGTDGIAVEECQPFLAPSLATAIDRANRWTEMEPWVLNRIDVLRLTEHGHAVWERRLSQ